MNKRLNQDYSRNLQNTNLEGYQHLILPGNSPIMGLENLLVKIKKFIRSRHLDINIPRLTIITIILISSIVMIKKNEEGEYNLMKDLGSLIGVGTGILFAMSNLHSQYHYNKRKRASEYIEEWRSKKMINSRLTTKKIFNEVFFDQHPTPFNSNLFNKCHSILIELKKTPDGVEILEEAQSEILKRLETGELNHKDEKYEVKELLNFFEHMGQDVKCNVADSDYLKDYFYSIVISNYEFFRKYIEYLQYDLSQRMMYCNFVYLAQTWEKEGFLPELPRICNRPLVITSRDLENVYSAKAKIIQKSELTSLINN